MVHLLLFCMCVCVCVYACMRMCAHTCVSLCACVCVSVCSLDFVTSNVAGLAALRHRYLIYLCGCLLNQKNLITQSFSINCSTSIVHTSSCHKRCMYVWIILLSGISFFIMNISLPLYLKMLIKIAGHISLPFFFFFLFFLLSVLVCCLYL